MTIASSLQTIEIDDLSKGVGTEIAKAGRVLQIKGFSIDGDQAQLTVHVSRRDDPANPPTNEFLIKEFETVAISDSTGRRLKLFGGPSVSQVDGFDFTYTCSAQPRHLKPPCRLVWQVVAGTEEVNVPFEFKDLPLPQP